MQVRKRMHKFNFIIKIILIEGWGKTENQSISPKLMQVSVPINDDSVCNFFIYDEATQICAGDTENRKDSCQGDSGGPLMKNINGHWTLIGIVSYGGANCNGDGVYTEVSVYSDWILRNK